MSLSLRYSGAFDVRWQGEVWGLPERQDTLRLWLALIFREGQAIDRRALADELWPALDREQRASRLRYHLHALKRYLPQVPKEAEGWLLIEHRHLSWNPKANSDSDLDRLRSGLKHIPGTPSIPGDVALARKRALELAALDRGPLLPAMDEPFLEAPRAEMDDLQVAALHSVAELHRVVGRNDAAIDRSDEILRRRPSDERAHRRLMIIAAAALAQDELQTRYERARACAREMEDRALRGETEALFNSLNAWLDRVGDTSSFGLRVRDPGLADSLTSEAFASEADRIDELGRLESLRALQSSERCITVAGAGGSGKSRLLIALLNDKNAGTTIAADLRRVKGEAGIYRELARLLELPDGLVVGESENAIDLFARTIGHRELCLVLDNGEGQASNLAGILPELLHRCPGLRIVFGSRETLRIADESVWRMPLLSVPRDRSGRAAHGEAMALLEQERRNRGQRLGLDERGAMARICIALDGLPVAIIAAAKALDDRNPVELAQHLEAQAGFILDCSLPRPNHFFYPNLEQSHNLELRRLGPRERRLLRGLADLQGPFDLDRIQELGEALEPTAKLPAGTTWVETLMLLRERSLIEVEVLPGGDYAYRILPTLRDFVTSLPEGFFTDSAAAD